MTCYILIHIHNLIETPSSDPATSNGPFDGAVVEEVPIQRKFSIYLEILYVHLI